MPGILLEMEKLSNPYSGLGVFCQSLGNALCREVNNYPNLQLQFFVPKACTGIFGKDKKYITASPLHKYFRLSSGNTQLWHCLHQDSPYLPVNAKTPLLLTVHDLNFIQKYSGWKLAYRKKLLQQKINRAKAITAISQFTANEIKNIFQVDKPIHIIPNGVNGPDTKENSELENATFGTYFFSIGILSHKKNFHALIPFLRNFPTHNLVIAGKHTGNYAVQLRKMAQEAGVSERLFMPGSVDEATKWRLYAGCTAFLFPSTAEGFGLPVIEAMHVGKPVFLAQAGALPETGGKEAYYWQDFEPEAMARVVQQGLANFYADATKATRLQARAATFSWQAAANNYLRLYSELSGC